MASEETREAVRALVEATYDALSTPGSEVAHLFGAADMAIHGSGQGELWSGPELAMAAAGAVASMGLRWAVDKLTVWQQGDVAWAQILGSVHVVRDGAAEVVPYWTTGVFGLDEGEWRWLYWGGSEPQESPKV